MQTVPEERSRIPLGLRSTPQRLELYRIACVQHRSSSVLFPNGLDAADGATWFSSLNAEPADRVVPFYLDRLDCSARYYLPNAAALRAGVSIVLSAVALGGAMQLH